MKDNNKTAITLFTIKGISDIPEIQTTAFVLILSIYLITFGGNMTILLLVYKDHLLHTPMYFFLGNLSIMDMLSTTVSLHHILISFISGDNTISFHTCMAQMYIYLSLVCADLLILTAMSYDRYVAICNPLYYPMVMNNTVCVLLASFSWFLAFTEPLVIMVLVLDITCYRSYIINHFFCDLVPLLELSCKEKSDLESVLLIEGIPASLIPFSLTLMSYIFIIASILRIRTSAGRRKAFYTCSSHLTVVSLFYVSIFFVYLSPTSMDSLVFKKISSLFNTVIVPLLNPLIYSFKNKDIKSALKRQLRCCKVTSKRDTQNLIITKVFRCFAID